MARMPDFEAEIRREWGAVSAGIEHLTGHDHDAPARTTSAETAAAEPTIAITPQEEPVSLATLETAVKDDLTNGIAYIKEFAARIEQAAPGIIGNAEAAAVPLVGKLAEAIAGRILPPPLEEVLIGLVSDFYDRSGQPAPAAPEQPTAPAA